MSWTLPTGSSNCYLGASVSVTQVAGLSSGSFFPVGVHTISYELIDQCGASAICNFVLEVAEIPSTVSITCPSDSTITMPTGPNRNYS